MTFARKTECRECYTDPQAGVACQIKLDGEIIHGVKRISEAL